MEPKTVLSLDLSKKLIESAVSIFSVCEKADANKFQFRIDDTLSAVHIKSISLKKIHYDFYEAVQDIFLKNNCQLLLAEEFKFPKEKKIIEKLVDKLKCDVVTIPEGFTSRYYAKTGAPGVRARYSQIESGKIFLKKGGNIFITINNGKLVQIDADINAAQNLQRFYWLGKRPVKEELGVQLFTDPTGQFFPSTEWYPYYSFWPAVHKRIKEMLMENEILANRIE